MTISLERQLACAKREIALRQRVYIPLVIHGKMSQEKADEETPAMQAISETLQKLISAQQQQQPLF